MYSNNMMGISLFIITGIVLVTNASMEKTSPDEQQGETVSNLYEEDTRIEQISRLNVESLMMNDESQSLQVELPDAPVDDVIETRPKGNVTLLETSASGSLSNATLKIYSNCLMDQEYGTVEVVNATRLMELLKLAAPTNRTELKNDGKAQQARTCLLVLFYARWCVFSSQAAPHFNALPRFFPHIKAVAIDASRYQNFNTQFGIVGVPTLMFIYNGKPLVKFNETSYTLEMFARFVTTYTALEPNGSLYVTSADFGGPVHSTPSNDTDYCLVVSWIFIAACAIYFTFQSRWWRQFVELVQNTWRESNAQHEHVD